VSLQIFLFGFSMLSGTLLCIWGHFYGMRLRNDSRSLWRTF